jgi:hypothetical protein
VANREIVLVKGRIAKVNLATFREAGNFAIGGTALLPRSVAFASVSGSIL